MIVAALMAITIAVSMIVSALYPRFRDVALIWSVLSTVLFYATPILYPISVAPQRFRDILQLNPLTPVFEQAQKWIIDPNAPGALGATSGSEYLLVASFAVFVALCAAAVWVFNREARGSPRSSEAHGRRRGKRSSCDRDRSGGLPRPRATPPAAPEA